MSNSAQTSASSRIAALLDENSFVEVGAYIAARNTDFNMTEQETPADGVVTGYGTIGGCLVYVYSQDAAVLGGSMGEMHAKKICNIYSMAMKMGAPVIGLVDCAGLRLQEATDALEAFGEIYMKQTLASGLIPQITGIFGTCGGGMALVPALTDFTFVEEKKGKLFVNTPNALAGNNVSKCDTSTAKFQSEEAGNVDFVGTESEIISGIINLVSILPSNYEDEVLADCTDDLNRAATGFDSGLEDTKLALTAISDDGFVVETKSAYAPEMLTAFIKLNGATVGVVANRTKVYDDNMEVVAEYEPKLTANGCDKAAQFVYFCDDFSIPVLTLTNATGFKACKCQEKRGAKATARLTYAFASATVPKVNVIIGEAFGSAYVTMNSKSIGADMVFALPTAKVGMMDANAAAKIMYAKEIEEDASVLAEKTAEYAQLQGSVTKAASRGYVDNIVEPVDVRKYVIGALEMLYTKRQ